MENEHKKTLSDTKCNKESQNNHRYSTKMENDLKETQIDYKEMEKITETQNDQKETKKTTKRRQTTLARLNMTARKYERPQKHK